MVSPISLLPGRPGSPARTGRIQAQDAPAPSAPPGKRSVSCVIPCFNEAANLDQLLAQLEEILARTRLDWEILVIDDGSTDNTAEVARPWCELRGFRYLSLSRNFGKEAALTAGLKAANGAAVIFLDGDLQHSPQLIATMVARWQDGADVVYTVREERASESFAKRIGTRTFYRLINGSRRFRLTEDAGDFRLMDRKVVDALLSLPERTRFMKGLYAWVGYKAVALPYTPAARAAGTTSYSLFRLIGLAVDGLTAFTTWPLRLVSVVGVLLALPALAYGSYLVAEHFFVGNPVSGWTTIVVSLMFFMGVQMVFTGILGEYVARIFEEVKGRPLYLVDQNIGHGLEKDAS
jgi:glycosyltransferase involved in cell wall biosynthesis